MRRALGLASALTILSLAGAALAQPAPAAVTGPPPPSCDNACGGAAGLPPTPSYLGGDGGAGTSRPRVFAVVGTHVVTGHARPDRHAPTGSLTLVDEGDPGFSCVGRYRLEPDARPTVRLACSDGQELQLTAERTASRLTFGLRAPTAIRHLAAPPGYVLVTEGRGLRLAREGA